MVSKVKLNFASEVTGLEELSRLINRVDSLEKAMLRYNAAAPRATAAAGKVTTALEGQSKSARRAQLGAQQLGFQINDLSTSITTGANPMIAFNQQLGQIGFALGQMGGRLGTVGAFLGGAWGAALGIAAMGIYTLITNMNSASDSAETMSEKIDKISFSSDQTATAQDILSKVMNTTTGAMTNQTAAAINLARAQLEVARVQARIRSQEARATLRAASDRTALTGKAEIAPNIYGGDGDLSIRQVRRPTVSAVEAGRALAGSTKEAIDNLRRLNDVGKITDDRFAEIASAAANLGVEIENVKSIEEALVALEKGKPFGPPKDEGRARAARERTQELTLEEKMLASLIAKYEKQDASLEIVRKAYQDGTIDARAFRLELERIEKSKAGLYDVDDSKIKVLQDGKKPFPDIAEMTPKIETEIDRATRVLERMQEAGENVGRAVSDAFKDMLTGARGWKDAMRSLIGSVIEQLWQLFVVQQIVGFFKKSFGGLFGGVSPDALPGRAMGGPVQAGQPYIVGEKRPELFVPNRSGTIVPDLEGMGGGKGIVVNVDARGAIDPAAVRSEVQRGILEAAPAIIAASEGRTIRTLRRPRLAGGGI